LRVIEIFPDQRRAADMDFPDVALRDRIAVLIAQFDEHADHGPAYRANFAGLVGRAEIGHQTDFGPTVEFMQPRLRKPFD